MARSNVTFVPTKADSVVVSAHDILIDEELLVGTELKEML